MPNISMARDCRSEAAVGTEQQAAAQPAMDPGVDADADVDDESAGGRGRGAYARSRGRSRRIIGPTISPTQAAAPAAEDFTAAGGEAPSEDGDLTPSGRGRGRNVRGGGRWGNRRAGASGRGSRGGSSTPRAGPDEEDALQAGLEHPPAAAVEPGAARDVQPAAAAHVEAEAVGAASDLGEAAEALLGMGMGLQPEYHPADAGASAAALHEGVSLDHL